MTNNGIHEMWRSGEPRFPPYSEADMEEPFAIVVDSRGNVIVTGQSWGEGTATDSATIKCSNTGIPLWTNRYNGPSNSTGVGRALAVDPRGNVFVTGESSNGVDYDYVTIKYVVPAPELAIQRVQNQIVLSWAPRGSRTLACDLASASLASDVGTA